MQAVRDATCQPEADERAVPADRRQPRDRWFALLVGIGVCALYLPTMFPGLGGGGDSTKFQFLGRVLGTAHQPGYPAYVLISHLFSYLPVGSLAYRMNLMSAFWAAVAAALMYLISIRLGAPRWAAATAAVSMAFGRHYWSYAVRAEVYTLAAALQAAVLLKLLDWRAGRRERDLYAAVAIAAVAFGNHLTIAFVVPALVTYVLLTDARAVARPRVLLVCAALVAAGLMQYSFIILRTLQHAPYIEASAMTVKQLLAVMTARRYASQMWVFDLSTVVSQRIPAALAMVREEIGVLGVALLIPGVYALARARWRETVLLGLAFLGLLVVAANVEADMDGFMVPAFVIVWPVAAAGLWTIASWLPARRHPALAGLAAATLVTLVVVPQAAGNYRVNDHHRRTFETRYFKALFDMLPARTVIVNEAYSIDQLVLYKLLGERAAGQRDIRLMPPAAPAIWDAARRGYRVFAFDEGRRALESLGFRFAAVALLDPAAAPPVPFDMKLMPLYRMTVASQCEAVGNRGWLDMTAIAARSGRFLLRIDNYRPFDSDAVLYVSAGEMRAPRLLHVEGTGAPVFETRAFRPRDAGGAPSLAAALREDGVDETTRTLLLASQAVCRVSLRVNDQGKWVSLEMDPGGRVEHAMLRARVDLNNPRRAMFCGQMPF